MSAAQLIETSEEDSSLAVARFIGDLLNDGEVSWPAWCIMHDSAQSPGGLEHVMAGSGGRQCCLCFLSANLRVYPPCV